MSRTYMVEQGTHHVVDVCGPGNKGIYSNKTQGELEKARGVAIELIASEPLLERTRAEARLAVREITRERWWDAFECMPPRDYRGGRDSESFFMVEPYSADVHWGYVRIADGDSERFFEFRDQVTMKHPARVALAREFIAANPECTLSAASD